MEIKKGEHLSILGTTGSGKTYAVRNTYLPPWNRIIVVDSEEYDFKDFPKVSIRQALKLAKSDYAFVVRVVISADLKADEPLIKELCQGLLKNGHDLVIYWDEVTDLADAHQIPPPLRQLIRKARKRGISVYVGSQRPAMLNKDFLANAQHRVYFFCSDYDCQSVHDYAPFLQERRAEIPYKSYKSLYQAPDESILVLGPSEEYAWGPRLRKGKK
jgi:energy-coupling factor transporter ATP-binding protein EcfA2